MHAKVICTERQRFNHLLHILAATTDEYEAWINGLTYLVQDTQAATFSLQTERFARSQASTFTATNHIMRMLLFFISKLNVVFVVDG